MCGCAALVAGARPPRPVLPRRLRRRRGSSVRAEVSPGGESQPKKVTVAGAGWAGFAAAHHLIKQGYDVTLLAAESGPTEEVGLRGFWQPYRNIFALVDELGISPFTGWNKAAYYSTEGLALQSLTSTTLTLLGGNMMQENSDFLLCRGEVEEKIFSPWLQSLELKGLKFVENKVPTSLTTDVDSGCISSIVCGDDVYEADAFVLAMGLSSLQSIVKNSPFLRSDREFRNLLHLSTVDVISVKLWFDKKIIIPKVANVCSGFDDSSGWAFFDLTSVYDDYCEESITIVEAEFYNASHLVLLSDDDIVYEASSHLIKCIQDFEGAIVIRYSIRRSPNSVINFLPGSYKYTLRGSTSFPNLFIAGDWIVNRHGSFSKEKAYVTGLEAGNRVVDYFDIGDFAKIIAVEGDEPHIETLRSLNRRANELKSQIPFSEFFLQ
ncbi:uncharacterized protein [Zea mays]|uniref:uncharacterized protein isoform X4 n=1 Tax=Zea mays TaxID=4577 RepID=UPI0004DEBC08|nr:uncharacterized protein LOC100275695 isoform X4 [Zea mays]